MKPHQSALFAIITERYDNALDHGLLALDTTLKEQEDSFERHMRERLSRLLPLKRGRVELGFNLDAENGRPVLEICVKDSGPGFEYTEYLPPATATERRPYGRGIALVRSLCHELTYFRCGSEARVKYILQE